MECKFYKISIEGRSYIRGEDEGTEAVGWVRTPVSQVSFAEAAVGKPREP